MTGESILGPPPTTLEVVGTSGGVVVVTDMSKEQIEDIAQKQAASVATSVWVISIPNGLTVAQLDGELNQVVPLARFDLTDKWHRARLDDVLKDGEVHIWAGETVPSYVAGSLWGGPRATISADRPTIRRALGYDPA